jgi:hypothetical protein
MRYLLKYPLTAWFVVSFSLVTLYSGCTTKLVSNGPPLPQKVTRCSWDVEAKTFDGDEVCEKFLRDYVSSRVGH